MGPFNTLDSINLSKSLQNPKRECNFATRSCPHGHYCSLALGQSLSSAKAAGHSDPLCHVWSIRSSRVAAGSPPRARARGGLGAGGQEERCKQTENSGELARSCPAWTAQAFTHCMQRAAAGNISSRPGLGKNHAEKLGAHRGMSATAMFPNNPACPAFKRLPLPNCDTCVPDI